MSDDTKTIVLCGVGGQGALLAADLLARCAAASGDDVKLSEIHGMAQRGGAVTTVVRIGSNVSSMVADLGCADFLLAFETTEALRGLPFLKAEGRAIVSDESIKPLPVLTGSASMPKQARARLKDSGAIVLPAELLAKQAGTAKAVNVVLLGTLSVYLTYEDAIWRKTIESRVPAKFLDANLAAFELGRKAVVSVG